MIVDKSTFCMWDAQNREDSYIIMSNLAISLCLLSLIIWGYSKNKKVQSNVLSFYNYLLGWAICTFSFI